MKLTEEQINQEIQHILDSGANVKRISNLIADIRAKDEEWMGKDVIDYLDKQLEGLDLDKRFLTQVSNLIYGQLFRAIHHSLISSIKVSKLQHTNDRRVFLEVDVILTKKDTYNLFAFRPFIDVSCSIELVGNGRLKLSKSLKLYDE